METIDQKTGTAAAISIVAAIGSYILVCAGHPVWALIAAIVSIPAGLIGLAMSASPKIKGGLMSIVAIVLGLIGIVFSILGIVGVIIF